MKITLISSSVRRSRNSHRVALFLSRLMQNSLHYSVEMADLNEYQFPLFEERLRNITSPTVAMLDFAKKIKQADGILIVTPEYNAGYPASLKNVIDLLNVEWYRKPIAIASVSNGPFGAAQVLTSLTFSLWKLGAWVVPSSFQIAHVMKEFDENGLPKEKEQLEKRASSFLAEFNILIHARKSIETHSDLTTK